jgi:hypothetical protein
MNRDLDNEPISKGLLILLGYAMNSCDEFCPPYPCDGGTYRVNLQATIFQGGKPVKGTEKWRAYLTDSNNCTIRRFSNLGELNYFHKGMCGVYLYNLPS